MPHASIVLDLMNLEGDMPCDTEGGPGVFDIVMLEGSWWGIQSQPWSDVGIPIM